MHMNWLDGAVFRSAIGQWAKVQRILFAWPAAVLIKTRRYVPNVKDVTILFNNKEVFHMV